MGFIFAFSAVNWRVISMKWTTIDPSPLPSISGNVVPLLLRDQPLQFAQQSFIKVLFINL